MKLILNGDDLGITRSVNFGMIDSYRHGSMSSCSLMVNMPGAEHAVELMRENFGLSIGIHLNLTVGKPLLEGHKTLIREDGTFNKGMLEESNHVDQDEIRRELFAQFERYIDLMGDLPEHINSHHGIEQIKGAEAIVCELANQYELPVRQFMHLYQDETLVHDALPYTFPKLKMPKESNVKITATEVMELFTQEEIESDTLFEFALHPGYIDYDLLQLSSYTNSRVYDAAVFMDIELAQWIEENNIELVSYQAAKLK